MGGGANKNYDGGLMRAGCFLVTLFICELLQAQSFMVRPPRKTAKIELGTRNDLTNKGADNRLNVYDGQLAVNIIKSTTQTLTFSGEFETLDTGFSDFNIGRENVSTDGHLSNQSVSLGYKRNIGSLGENLSLTLSYGSASDKTFSNSRNNAVNLTATYGFKKSNEKSQWLLLLNYSNNRTFLNNIPLPSVGYLYRPSDKFTVFAGLPFISLTWVDFPNYIHSISISPASLKLDFSWGILGPIRFYSLFNYQAQSYLHLNRSEDELRLLFVEKRVGVGLRAPVSRAVSFDFGLGYSFDRYLFEGEGVYSKIGDKLYLDEDMYCLVKASVSF